MRKYTVIFLLFSLFLCFGFSFNQKELTEKELDLFFQYLKEVKDVPYVWGGETPNELDCSGLVLYLLRKLGYSDYIYQNKLVKDITAHNFYHFNTKKIHNINQAKRGDLIFLDTNGSGYYAHVVIFEKIDKSGVIWVWDASESPDGVHTNKVDRRPLLTTEIRNIAVGRILVVTK